MTRMCDICGVRPAVGTIQRVRSGQSPQTLHLCEIHLAEQRMPGLGSGFGGLSIFDDFFSRFLGNSPGTGTVRSTPRSERRVEQVDVTELFSDATNELLQRAARTAVDWGNRDIDTDHLLHAAAPPRPGVVLRGGAEHHADPAPLPVEVLGAVRELAAVALAVEEGHAAEAVPVRGEVLHEERFAVR